MRRIFFVALLITSITSSCFSLPYSFSLYGKIKGIDSGTVVLSYWLLKENKFTQVSHESVIKEGFFKIIGKLDEPVMADLKINETGIEFYIEPSNLYLNIDINNPEKFKLKGSATHNDYILCFPNRMNWKIL